MSNIDESLKTLQQDDTSTDTNRSVKVLPIEDTTISKLPLKGNSSLKTS